MTAKYVLGIDLGTTNSVLSYAALDTQAADVKLFDIPQLVSAGTTESRTSLPSFTYLATAQEASDGALDLPWTEARAFAVGEFARERAAEAPDRTVGAADPRSGRRHPRRRRRSGSRERRRAVGRRLRYDGARPADAAGVLPRVADTLSDHR